MEIPSVLRQLGLTDPQSRVYLALLRRGPSNITDIAGETGMHRPVVYRDLPELQRLRLVTSSKAGKRTVYAAEPPARLVDMARQLEERLQEALPDLISSSHAAAKPIVRHFQGPQGIRAAYEDLLATVRKGDVVHRYESPIDRRRYAKYQPKAYFDRILAKGEVEWFIITNDPNRAKVSKRLERAYRTVPLDADQFKHDISQFIYHDKVSYIDFAHEVATIIESLSFADFQRKIFKLLFDRLR
jgi:sugar-specific transcriptional regulator TrmB